jgi:hypothetical protein
MLAGPLLAMFLTMLYPRSTGHLAFPILSSALVAGRLESFRLQVIHNCLSIRIKKSSVVCTQEFTYGTVERPCGWWC